MDNSTGHLIGGALALIIPLVIVAISILSSAIKILREYERGVVFRLGRLRDGTAKGPGVILLWPIIDKMVRMDLRVVTIDVPKKEKNTKKKIPANGGGRSFFFFFFPHS